MGNLTTLIAALGSLSTITIAVVTYRRTISHDDMTVALQRLEIAEASSRADKRRADEAEANLRKQLAENDRLRQENSDLWRRQKGQRS